MSFADLQEERERLGLDPNQGGLSIADRVNGGEGDEYEQEELFVLEQGRRVTISNLIARNTPIEYRMTLNSRSFRGGGDMGLLPFSSPEILLIVPARQGKVIAEPTYDEGGEVEKVTIRCNFKPLTAHDATSAEGRALLGLEE